MKKIFLKKHPSTGKSSHSKWKYNIPSFILNWMLKIHNTKSLSRYRVFLYHKTIYSSFPKAYFSFEWSTINRRGWCPLSYPIGPLTFHLPLDSSPIQSHHWISSIVSWILKLLNNITIMCTWSFIFSDLWVTIIHPFITLLLSYELWVYIICLIKLLSLGKIWP